MTWTCKPFSQLSTTELYAILQLRTEVFVVEQQCVFQDMDNKDQHCLHLFTWKGDVLAAYARLVPAGISFAEPSIGRVVSSPLARGTGVGRQLMQEAIRQLYQHWGPSPVRIGAQLYLENFYASLGFLRSSENYPEDNILHLEMLLPLIHG
ncbi:MAG: GNAT family N-acetyltransferase [Candidatus Pseudobacter hemicellulosilyticus]|uniref:GNAT family N-acetyltransferase n=1 Tax=Candidatus Pseudobacter hemicellulosilyticus TaxID=3121375 RepID=A0AAJ5WR33_9BACT|nr:MAG: GNAT family N-acetyltransferase [Pseudobacter sp.]